MIAFNRQLNGIEAYLKANRDHGSRPLLERRQFCLQSGSNRRSLALSGNMTGQRDCDFCALIEDTA
jgi:hypothetical protein